MDVDEQIELLADVWREQVNNSRNKDMGNLLEDKVEVRSVNFSIEEKLDKIIELLEKLVPKPVTVNSPITVEGNKDVGVDINKHLYELANKVQRRQNGECHEEFNKIDWDKLVKSFGVLPDNSLETAVKRNLLPKVVYRDVFKKHCSTDEVIKIGVIDEHNRVSLLEPPDFVIKSPHLYYSSWLVKHPALIDSFMSVKPEGLMTIDGKKGIQNEIVITRRGNTFTTGVITSDGKAVYYDQYLE